MLEGISTGWRSDDPDPAEGQDAYEPGLGGDASRGLGDGIAPETTAGPPDSPSGGLIEVAAR